MPARDRPIFWGLESDGAARIVGAATGVFGGLTAGRTRQVTRASCESTATNVSGIGH